MDEGDAIQNPDPSWLNENVWADVLSLCDSLSFFKDVANSFAEHTDAWYALCQASQIEYHFVQ